MSLEAELRRFAPTLVPELPLWLLPPDAPSWHAVDPAALGWPYWAFAWPGGQALARVVLDAPRLVRGLRVLDLGSGCAIEGLAALRAGAASVLCADVDATANRLARRNAAALGLELATTEDDVVGRGGPWELILAGDFFFDPGLTSRALAWLEAERARGVTVLLGDAGRVPFSRAGWEVLATHAAPFDGDPRALTRWPVQVLRGAAAPR